jgi:hypothetical protein
VTFRKEDISKTRIDVSISTKIIIGFSHFCLTLWLY